jgi:predicted dithiol-disulfide oxidoreductase (DUF899 family)
VVVDVVVGHCGVGDDVGLGRSRETERRCAGDCGAAIVTGNIRGEQLSVLNVFSRDEDGIHHRWASELTFVRGDNSPLDAIWPIWGVLDLTPNGRGQTAAYPALQYE